MPVLTIRNVSDELHRALRVRAKEHGRSMESEVRFILDDVLKEKKRVKLGSLMASIAKEAGGLTEEEAKIFDNLRDKTSAEPIKFD